MALTLVHSGNSRPLEIRDHLVPLVRLRGILEIQHGIVRVITWRTGAWFIEHWTPFSDLSSDEASSPGYRHALERQRTMSALPYGLAVRHDEAKVMSVLWADDGTLQVIEFVRGHWEVEALAL